MRTDITAIAEHTYDADHQPNWSGVQCIAHDLNWYARRVKEAIQCGLHPNTLNSYRVIDIPQSWMSTIRLHTQQIKASTFFARPTIEQPTNQPPITDHTILVNRLHTDFGFTDTVLQWFSSYLTDRTHYVSLCNHCSDFAPVHSGVPQGSILGPILFTMYIKPLSAIIDSHYIIHHSFADDLQLQISAPPDRISELLHSMQSCISGVKVWATANMLKLNDSKTELMLVTSKRSKHLHNLPTSITIGNAQIPFCEKIGFYIGLSSYYEFTCLQYCSDMLL